MQKTSLKTLGQRIKKARKNKDWKKADELREALKKKGYFINDTEGGAEIKSIK